MLNSFLDKFLYTSTLRYVHNNFYLAELPFVILPVDILLGICAEQNLTFDKILYEDVKEATLKNLVKSFDSQFRLNDHQFLKLLEDFISASGWGAIETLSLDMNFKRAILKVENSPIAMPLKGKVNYPVDHILRGFFAGIFSHYFKDNVDCVELKCYATNYPFCEFVIKRTSDFDFNNEIVRRQINI
ncbi:MAG: 4-vinyl reductase [Candidatus Diapherotrites archaeon]|nr:4-vinyl reductase [Candidatus Diapherotrites archaeon]